MDRFTTVYRNRKSSCISLNNFGKILALVVMLGTVTLASATPALSRVSCGSKAYTGSATDPCSVYLTTKTNSRFYVTLSSNNPAVVVPSGVTVKNGAMSTGFKATVSSVSTAQVATITAQAGSIQQTFSITLTPVATGTAAMTVNASSIAFGGVTVNTPVSQPITVSSTGTAPLTVNSDAMSGAGFSVSGASLPATLNPGQSLTLQVQFDPTSAGSFSGQLTIASNASTSTVSLSGIGDAHEVDLSWVAPSGSADPVVGYNVYRAPSGTGAYQLVNGAVEADTAYTDLNVQSGVAYDYIVTSVDAVGVESVPSNVTTVTVP